MLGLTAALLGLLGLLPTSPPWDEALTGTEHCIEWRNTSEKTNSSVHRRLMFVSIPNGATPKGGWPVYFSLVTDPFGFSASPGAARTDCGVITTPQIYDVVKPWGAFDPPSLTIHSDTQYCLVPNGSDSTFKDDGMNNTLCFYDARAGSVWDQRLKQMLVAAGFAVVQLNPAQPDSWDAWAEAWDGGTDQPVLRQVFAALRHGAYGPLNADRVAIRGWSSGAQLVSWLYQLDAVAQGEMGISPKAGVMVSGGSYQCYGDPPAVPGVGCDGCLPDCHYPEPDEYTTDKFSSCHLPIGASNATGVCCAWCCPRGFTEDAFHANPALYAKHPPTFLTQSRSKDYNADLCAARNYHATLQDHGVTSVLFLPAEQDEACGCIGSPRDTASHGSPFERFCNPDWELGTTGCYTHAQAFAGMVPALVTFLNETL